MSDAPKPEARLTREDIHGLKQNMVVASDAGDIWDDDFKDANALADECLAQREEIERLRKAAVALYYAAYWHADRPVDEAALWMALRDAAEITPGHTASVLGPDRSGETVERLAGALRRIRAWDHMDTAADGAFWRAEIDKLLEEAGE
jgi:hypothetical protein